MATKPIIVGTDGSEQAMTAVEWAALEAGRRQAPLRIVSVETISPFDIWPPPHPGVASPQEHSASERALARAAVRATELAPHVLVDADVVDGSPAVSLVASASGASLLVVGSRGAGGFAAMILGSVSRYAATQAVVPVVVVGQENTAVHNQIAVGVRDCDAPGPALLFAFEEAALRKTALLAVHAWFHPALRLDREAESSFDPAKVSAGATEELSRALEPYRERYPAVPVDEQVVNAHPGHALADLTAHADLVVLGRRGGGAVPPGVGAVTHAVLNHAHGPVACVPTAV
jgi:nucleotide-binding universal stress UspA family protein